MAKGQSSLSLATDVTRCVPSHPMVIDPLIIPNHPIIRRAGVDASATAAGDDGRRAADAEPPAAPIIVARARAGGSGRRYLSAHIIYELFQFAIFSFSPLATLF